MRITALVIGDLLYTQLLYPAMALIARGCGPRDADPRVALAHFAIPVRATALWRWPFAPDTDYLVCATVTGAPLNPSAGSPA